MIRIKKRIDIYQVMMNVSQWRILMSFAYFSAVFASPRFPASDPLIAEAQRTQRLSKWFSNQFRWQGLTTLILPDLECEYLVE